MSKTIRDSGGIRTEDMEQDFDHEALAGADDSADSLRALHGNVQEYRSIADRLQSNMRPDNEDPFKDLDAPMDGESVFSSLDGLKDEDDGMGDDGWASPAPSPYKDDSMGLLDDEEDEAPAPPPVVPVAPPAAAAPVPPAPARPVADVSNGWMDDDDDLPAAPSNPLAGTPFDPEPAAERAEAAAVKAEGAAVRADAAAARSRTEVVMPNDWSLADDDPDAMVAGLADETPTVATVTPVAREIPVSDIGATVAVPAAVAAGVAAAPAARAPRKVMGFLPFLGKRKKVVVSDADGDGGPVEEMIVGQVDADGDGVADTVVAEKKRSAFGGRRALLWALIPLALAGGWLTYSTVLAPPPVPAVTSSVQPLPAEDGASGTIPLPPESENGSGTIPLPPEGEAAVPAQTIPLPPEGDVASVPAPTGEETPAEAAVEGNGETVTTLTVPLENAGEPVEGGALPEIPADDAFPSDPVASPAAAQGSIDDLFAETPTEAEAVDSEEVAAMRRSIDDLTLRLEAQSKTLSESLAAVEALEESIRLRDSAMDVQDRKIAEAADNAGKAHELAMQQNEVLIQFARVEETVNQMGGLIGQMTARLSQQETVTGGMDKRMNDLGTQFKQLRRDLGAVMRTTLDPADLVAPVVEAPSLPVPSGAGAVYQPADEPLRLPEGDLAVPADVKVGDDVAGAGKVLAIDDMADGRRLVIMEDGKQAIID